MNMNEDSVNLLTNVVIACAVIDLFLITLLIWFCKKKYNEINERLNVLENKTSDSNFFNFNP